MQKFRKILSVFLAVLMLASVFSINVSAGFIGESGSIGNSSLSAKGYAVYLGTGVTNANYYVVGYRFSIVDTTGGTLKNSADGKFRTIDLIRYGDVIGKDGNGKDILWGTSASHGNRMAYANGSKNDKGQIISGSGNSSKKMQVRYNKYQWNDIYRNNKNANVTRVNERSEAGTNTYGIHYACTSSVHLSSDYSSDYFAFSTLLPATSGIKIWTESDTNRAVLLNTLGYSGVTENNVDSKLGNNRIVIEPLYRVMWANAYTVFSAADLAVMNWAYYKSGNANFKATNDVSGASGIYGEVLKSNNATIRYKTNRDFQQVLWADENLRMPSASPLTVPSSLKSNTNYGGSNISKSCWTYEEILTSTLGMALYYDEPTVKVALKIKYKTKIGNLQCPQSSDTYGKNSSNIVTQDGSEVVKTWYPYTTHDLNDPATFGLSAPTGYTWNTINGYRSWRFYSYNSNETQSYYYQLDQDTKTNAQTLWRNTYYDAGSNTWRYDFWGDKTQAFTDYTEDQLIYAFPDIRPNKLTINYHANGGTGSATQTANYNSAVTLHSGSGFTREGYYIKGWSVSPRTAADYTLSKGFSKSQDFVTNVKDALIKKGGNSTADLGKGNTTIDLYAVWEKNDAHGKIEIFYNSTYGDIKEATRSDAALGSKAGGMNSPSYQHSNTSANNFLYWKSSLFSQTPTYGNNFNTVNYSTFGLERDGYVPLADTSGLNGYLWKYTVYNSVYDSTNNKFVQKSNPVSINENENMSFAELMKRLNTCPIVRSDGTTHTNPYIIYDLSAYTDSTFETPTEGSKNFNNINELDLDNETYLELDIRYNESEANANGYAQYAVIYLLTKSNGKWYMTGRNIYYYKDNQTYRVVDRYDLNVLKKSKNLSTSTVNGFTFSYLPASYAEAEGAFTRNGSVELYGKYLVYNLYAQWIPADDAIYVSYNTNNGVIDEDVNNPYSVVDGAVHKTANGKTELFMSDYRYLIKDAYGLANYSSFGLHRPGYYTTGKWSYSCVNYSLNANGIFYENGEYRSASMDQNAELSGKDIWETALGADNRIISVVYKTADGTVIDANTINSSTSLPDGTQMTITWLKKLSDTNDIFRIAMRLEKVGGKWNRVEQTNYYVYSSKPLFYYTQFIYDTPEANATANSLFGMTYYSSSPSETNTVWYDDTANPSKFPIPHIYVDAEWLPYNLNVVYHSNDGTDQTSTDTFIWDNSVITKGSIFTREGYVFKGWALAPDSNVVTHAPNKNLGKAQDVDPNLISSDCTLNLYAVWSDTAEPQDVYAVIWRDRTSETSPLKDYSMNLYKESGELVKTVATDEKGVASFGNIDEGLYYVEVTTSQTGYQYLVADGLQNKLNEASRKDTQRFDIVVDKDNVVDVKVAEGKTVVDSGKDGVVAPFWLESNATVKVTGNIDSNAWYVPDTAQFNIGSTAATFRAGETTEQFIYIRELAVNGTFNVTAPVSEKECFKWSVIKSDNSKAPSITVSDNDLINAPNHIYNVVLDYAMLCSATYTVTFSSDDGSPIPNGKTVSLVAKYTNATGNGQETVASAVIENGKVTFTNIDIGKNKGYTEYSLVIPSDIAGSGYTVALFDGASSVSVDTFRVHDHKAAATYKIVKDAVSKGNIIIDVRSIVTAPTQFADKWNNPEGKTSVVTLYVNGTVKAIKNVTIPKSGGPANTITFANMEVGTYTVKITVPTKDYLR